MGVITFYKHLINTFCEIRPGPLTNHLQLSDRWTTDIWYPQRAGGHAAQNAGYAVFREAAAGSEVRGVRWRDAAAFECHMDLGIHPRVG